MNSNISDLSLNLFAEAVGIVFTVFFVDRLIKRREKIKWAAAQNSLYARLLRDVSLFLYSIFRSSIELPSLRACMFGDRHAPVDGSYKNVESGEIEKRVKECVVSGKAGDLQFSAGRMKNSVESVLAGAADVLEPDDLPLCYELDDHVASMASTRLWEQHAEMREMDRENLIGIIVRAARAAVNLHVHLEDRATGRFRSIEEWGAHRPRAR